MAKKKQSLVNVTGGSKYKQLKISEFLLLSKNKTNCKLDMDSNISNTVNRKVNKRNNFGYEIYYPVSEYYVPIPEERIHKNEEGSPKKCRKMEIISLDSGNHNTNQHTPSTKTKFYNKLQLKKPVSNLKSIGVFPPVKVGLEWDKYTPQLLKEKSKLDQSLSSSNFVSDDSEVETATELESTSDAGSQALCTILSEKPLVSEKPSSVTTQSDEDKKENHNYLVIFKMVYDFVSSHPMYTPLLDYSERCRIEIFLNEMDERYSHLCIRLFLRSLKWTNIFKLKNDLGLNMSDVEVKLMYDCLNELGFIVSDYSSEPVVELLNLLYVSDLKEICKNFKLNTTKLNKTAMINKLLNNCNFQPILVPHKTTTAILIEMIKNKLGICIKLSPDFHKLLQKIHLLYSYTTNEFKNNSDMYFYLSQIKNKSIVLPLYYISDDITVFSSLNEFDSYVKAVQCRKEIEQVFERKQRHFLIELCELAYEHLVAIGDCVIDQKPAHLFTFTPFYAYVKALSFGVQFLTKNYADRAEVFLKFLLSKRNYFPRMCGGWYDTLIKVMYNYSKKHQEAAEIIIQALSDQCLSEVDQCLLIHRAEYIKNSKTNKLPKLLAERICFAESGSKLPFIEIDAREIICQGTPKKKLFIKNTVNGQLICNVEEFALQHYLELGFSSGFHCEGSLIWTIFSLLCWDIIYDEVPAAFLTEIQYLPLDFYTKEFYTTRKEAFDKLFENIEYLWSKEELKMLIKKNWTAYANKRSLISTSLNLKYNEIFNIIMCIKLEVLLKIFRRMLSDMRSYRSGFPDLFIWNGLTKECKFVEVKSQKDKLSCKQEVWMKFLKSIGCNVEVCHVHSIGEKSRAKYKKKQ